MKKLLSTTVLALALVLTSNSASAGSVKTKKVKKAPVEVQEVKQEKTGIRPYVSVKGSYAKSTSSKYVEDYYYSVPSYSYEEEASGKQKIFDHAYGVRIAVGAQIDVIRAEIEYGWNDEFKETSYDEHEGHLKQTLKTQTVLFNVYYDLFTRSGFTPYISAGVGVAHLKAADYYEVSNNAFAWQVGAGVSYAFNDNLSMDIGYRYMDYGDLKKYYHEKNSIYDWSGNFKAELKTNEVLVGLRYTF